jgi:alpha-beta hydrolase superfamily lysophospholipase
LEFDKFDYREKGNLERYGTKETPVIDISKIKHVPLAIFAGKQDEVVGLDITEWVAKTVNTTIHYEEIDNFSHSSYHYAKNMTWADNLLDVIKRENPKLKI